MIIVRSKKFKKQYAKQPKKVQVAFKKRLQMYTVDQDNPQLRIHELKGRLQGMYSMDVNGDVRALFEVVDDEVRLFQMIGSHSQLY